MRKPSDKRPASASVRQSKRVPHQAASMTDKKTAVDRRLSSSTSHVRGGHVQDFTLRASGLGRGVAQVLRHVRSGKLSGGVTYANELIRKHPLQAVLIGLGLRFLFSRTRLGNHDAGHRSILG
jgi:hypothetical protein